MEDMVQTTAERQATLRAKRAEQGLREVRGVFLPPALHAELKKLAEKLGRKKQQNPKPPGSGDEFLKRHKA